MHNNLLILRTEQEEENRKKLLLETYDGFINYLSKFSAAQINNKLLFLKIDLKENNYSYDSSYLTDINTNPKILEYGISCKDIVHRIDELMKEKNQPYRASYLIDWYAGKGFNGFLKKLKCDYPYVKSVNFTLSKLPN